MPSNKKILIVEDEPITAEDLKNILIKLDYEVLDIVNNGEDAVEDAITHMPDLIFMDVRIQGKIDGIETAMRIKKAADIPIIYITAYADDETLKRAIKTEPYGYIVKPFKKPEINSSIEIAIYKHKKEKELKDFYNKAQNKADEKPEYTKRQYEIIETALKIIKEEGVQKLTIKNIATQINVSLPAIYKHFSSKTAIIEGIMRIIKNEFSGEFERISISDLKPIEKIKLVVSEWTNKYSENENFIPILTSSEILRGEGQTHSELLTLIDNNKKVLNKLIEEAQQFNEINEKADTESLSTMIIGSINELVSEWNNLGHKFDLKERSKKLWETFKEILKI